MGRLRFRMDLIARFFLFILGAQALAPVVSASEKSASRGSLPASKEDDDDDREGGHRDIDAPYRNRPKVRFERDPQDSPDPFAPPAETSTLQVRLGARVPGEKDREDDGRPGTYRIRAEWSILEEGRVIRTVSGETDVSRPRRVRGWEFVPRDFSLAWDGSSNAGALVPPGTYRYRVQGALLRLQADRKRTRTTVIDLTRSHEGAITVRSAEVPPPTIQILRPVGEAWVNQATAMVEGTVTGGTSPVSLTVNGQAVALDGDSFLASVSLTDEGASTIIARVVDAEGRQAEQSVTIHRDSTPPRISIDQPASGSTLSGNKLPYIISYTDPPPGTGVRTASWSALLDGDDISANFTVGPAGATYSPTLRQPEGPHSMSVRIADADGNIGEALSSFTVNAIPEMELTPRYLLDLDHRGSVAPPEIVASRVIPPILAGPEEVVFLAPDGTVRGRIPLDDDPTLWKEATLSPGYQFVVIGESVRADVEFGPVGAESYEAGDISRTFSLYDSSGNQRVTTSATDAHQCQVSDGGTFLLRHGYTGEIHLVNRVTGAQWHPTIIPGPRGTTPSVAGISPDGDYVVVGAGEPTLDGKSGQGLVAMPHSISDMRERGRTLGWVGLFTSEGERLWVKQLPEDGAVSGVAVATGAEAILVVSDFEKYDAQGQLRQAFHPGFLLNREGEVVKTSDRWGLGSHGIEVRPDLPGFLLADSEAETTKVVHFDGIYDTTKLIGSEAGKGTAYDVSKVPGETIWHLTGWAIAKSVRPDHVSYLCFKDENRLHLAVVDFARRGLHASNISSFFNGSASPGFQAPSTGDTLEESRLKGEDENHYRVSLIESADGRFLLIRVGRILRIFDVRRI